MGRQLGLTDEQLQALDHFDGNSALTRVERLVLRYVVGMSATPVEVSNEVFDQLRQNFDSRQLVELTSCIAWENYRARFDHAFSIEAEEFCEGAYCPVPERPAITSVE